MKPGILLRVSWFKKIKLKKLLGLFVLFTGAAIAAGIFIILNSQLKAKGAENLILQTQVASLRENLNRLKSEDQYLINQELKEKIGNIKTTYVSAVNSYEELVKLKKETKDTADLDNLFAESLSLLSRENWTTASAKLAFLNQGIITARAKLAASFAIPENVPVSSSPPASGSYSRQSVQTQAGNFLVSLVAGDLSSTRVIVDTASNGDCFNDCPVLSLADYAGRNGAYAGVNGSYFCPAEYPSCSDKKNSFDTLLMNKNKVYFNSANNVYSTVPAAIFLGGSVRFVGQSLEWGRDTSPDSLIANRPLLLMGGNIMFNGEGEAKEGSRGGRSFVANRGNTVYIGVVHSATVAESAQALKALGMENAINLDNGGSTALWYAGYKVGPGRNLPNAILFVKK